MKLKHKINIDILEFFQTGKFDYLKPGQTKNWILNNFPDPDDFGLGKNLNNAKIWRYGNLELHFDEQELFLIFADHIDILDGGDSIDLDKWILDKQSELDLEKIIKEFNKLKMDFSVTNKRELDLIELKIIKSKVKLTFHGDNEKDINKFKLGSFSLMRY